MKIKITMLLSVLYTAVLAQDLKIVNAVQHKDSEYFDFEDYDENQNSLGELIFLPGCSWYCGGFVESINASSELKDSNSINYSAENAHDYNKNTAWVEGNPDYGVGEYIEYVFDFSSVEGYEGTLGINKILLANGYKKSKDVWKNNSRVKQLKVYLNDKPYAILNLLDSYEIQTVEIGEIKFPANETTKLKFEITKVYKGTKYKDTAISLLMFEGVGVH